MDFKTLEAVLSFVVGKPVTVAATDKLSKLFDNQEIAQFKPTENFESQVQALDRVGELSIKEEDSKKREAQLHKLNKELLATTYIGGNQYTSFDLIYFVLLHPWISKLNDKERFIFCNITRWFNFIQNTKFLNNGKLALVPISTTPPPPEPPKPAKKEGAKPAAEGDAKKPAEGEEKKKGSGREKPAAPVLKNDVSRFEIRVGKIVDCTKHTDKLYCEKIDLGEAAPRTIISGLVAYIPLEEMMNRMVLVLCNLKPRNMQGVKSEGMVLCASDETKTKVEFIEPPVGAKPGERVEFAQYPGDFDKVLKPETVEAVLGGLITNGDKIATYKGDPFTTKSGPCFAKTILNGHIG